jgi:transcriptional regulator with XRE-family HTH domain
VIDPVVQQLFAWRVRHGLSQKQTADLLRSYNFPITASALRNWEEGRRTPRDHTAEILGHLLKELPSMRGAP